MAGSDPGVDRGRFEAPPIEIKFAVNPAAWLGNRLGRADEGGVPGASEVGAEVGRVLRGPSGRTGGAGMLVQWAGVRSFFVEFMKDRRCRCWLME